MKKNSSNKNPNPELSWQTGAYNADAEFKFFLPSEFLLLCKLMNTKPEKIIRDFIDNLSCGSWNRQGRDQAKEHLVNYFIAHGYGRHCYGEEDIRQMFKEMDALGLLFPHDGKMKLIDSYVDWRDKHRNYWFKKWSRKPGQKKEKI